MYMDPAGKYRPFPTVNLPDRQWPGRTIQHAPYWAAVDLRDGNQALVDPMGPDTKQRLFRLLVDMGMKQIEVGFPAASETDYAFVRLLIENGLIPEDVTIQVLTPARQELIDKTFDAIEGADQAIVHLFNPTSTLQREVVFGAGRQEIIDLATFGTRTIRDRATRTNTRVTLQYSPESFTGTELDFARDVSDAVMAEWGATPETPMILNLPATVEMATPNVHADQIEWMARGLADRDSAIISVHPHNDRGTAVAAAELAMMAGADRVEGTLFGNGERTGNVDIVTLALNMYTQGVDPGLDLSDLGRIKQVAEACTGMPVPPRHPYAGDLVFTAFSGSHQDAINKGLKAVRARADGVWEVPYLPVDPEDLGRSYEAVIRVNSQSGKGGVSHVLERDHGLELPRAFQIDIAQRVQKVADDRGRELTAAEIHDIFRQAYEAGPPDGPGHTMVTYDMERADDDRWHLRATIDGPEGRHTVDGTGNGPVDAFVNGVRDDLGVAFDIADYHEHAVGQGADAQAVSYLEAARPDGGRVYAAGRDSSIVMASLKAVLAAVDRL